MHLAIDSDFIKTCWRCNKLPFKSISKFERKGYEKYLVSSIQEASERIVQAGRLASRATSVPKSSRH
jgi:hypothetical protein